MLLESKASPQIRNRLTGRYPLHEAADRGHVDVVTIMLALCVTPLSRTKEDETPADLARKNGFYACARRLGTFLSLSSACACVCVCVCNKSFNRFMKIFPRPKGEWLNVLMAVFVGFKNYMSYQRMRKNDDIS